MFDFTGKIVLITGAGAGIGAESARMFADAGAEVILNSVSPSAETVAEEIRAKGQSAAALRADVSREEEVCRLFAQTEAHFGHLDVLVNCAGVVSAGNVEETSLEAWERTMAVNVTGTFLMCRYAMPYLKKSHGVIVNIASLVAVKGVKNRAAYSASKGAVLALTKAMAADYLSDGIRVNCISPGTVLSPSLKARIASEPDPEAAYGNYVSRQPMGRLGRPEEIAAAILFAASDEAAFMDGVNIPVDGAGSL